MKILLCSINSKYIHSSLGVWYLSAAAEKINTPHTVQVHEATINQSVEDIVSEIACADADIVGFSTYIWNIDYVHRIAKVLKQIKPKLKIFLGGPEASFDAEKLLNCTYIDWIIQGEGEAAFTDLLQNSFQVPEKQIITGRCMEYINPYTKQYFESLNGRICYLETSRGCPFSCGFCLSGRHETVRFFDLEESKQNILKLANSGTQTVKFVDRTFNCNDERALEIFQFIHNEYKKGNIPSHVIFHFEVEADLFTQKTLFYLKTVPKGLFQFEAGLQSFHVPTLKAVNRRSDITRLVNNLKSIAQGENIHLHIDLIAGLPFENYETFAKGFDLAYEIKAHVIQLGFLKLLKGSQLEKEKEQYQYVNWEHAPYQVVKNDSISYFDLLRLKQAEDAVERLLNSGKFKNTIEYLLTTTKLTPFALFYQFGSYFAKQGISSPGLEVYSKSVFTFFKDFVGVDAKTLRDVMVIDKIITDRTGRLYGFTHILDQRFKEISHTLKTVELEIFDQQIEKAKQGKIGFAILYQTNQIVLADYTNFDPVFNRFQYEIVPLTCILTKNLTNSLNI